MRYLQKHYGCNEGNICQFGPSRSFLLFPQIKTNFNRTFTARYGNTLNSVNGSSG